MAMPMQIETSIVHWRFRSGRKFGPSASCQTLVTSDGTNNSATASTGAMTRLSNPIETVGRPRPITPLTNPARVKAPVTIATWARLSMPDHCQATRASTIGYASATAEQCPRDRMTKPRIAITYCTQCHWLLRAAWMAQELLSTFSEELGEVALRPATGGAFQIEVDGEVIWERKRDGGFPDVKTLKQRVRDKLAPERDLGHVDR